MMRPLIHNTASDLELAAKIKPLYQICAKFDRK